MCLLCKKYVLCSRWLSVRNMQCASTSTHSFQRIRRPKGRMQWWREPVYYSPHIHPLQRGVDFTFLDGRPILFTSKFEADRKAEQIELGKKIVKYLSEMREAEELHTAAVERQKKMEEEWNRWSPKSKGVVSIS
ncbi:hypothetical protein AB6A40_006691 [Gnathostoma spinigerum]|uniref:39S ribosomal protein L52, mitochondrial n=1 Tax=Gnathostoma spinigerum TaxID=75299 RepID=A0ABD6ETH5_9BILA